MILAQRNDYSAMVGYGIVAAGSAVIAVGCCMVVAGAGASATGAGLPAGVIISIVGGILVAAGWVIAVFTKDSDFKLRYGNDSPENGPDRQHGGPAMLEGTRTGIFHLGGDSPAQGDVGAYRFKL